MKKIFAVFTMVMALFIVNFATNAEAQQKFNVPEYSIEGLNKIVRYYEYVDKKWVKIVDNAPPGHAKPTSDKPILEKHVYHVDRNKDSRMDLAYIENFFPAGFAKKSDPALKTVILSVDDNFDCVPERWLLDGEGAGGAGNLAPADGIYDVEVWLGDTASHDRERKYWKDQCK